MAVTTDPATLKLRPCPFCREDKELLDGSDETKSDYPTEWFVFCDGCGAHGPHMKCAEIEFGGDESVQTYYTIAAREAWGLA